MKTIKIFSIGMMARYIPRDARRRCSRLSPQLVFSCACSYEDDKFFFHSFSFRALRRWSPFVRKHHLFLESMEASFVNCQLVRCLTKAFRLVLLWQGKLFTNDNFMAGSKIPPFLIGSQYPSIAEEIKSVASADPVNRKLFVRGLAWNTTSETLCAAFSVHGEIEEGAVIYDKATGKSRGYGFITYKHMESTKTALKAPSKIIDGRMAVCNLACEGLSGSSTTPDLAQRKLYIGGLSPDISSELLLSFFGRYGDIEEGSVAYDKDTNESRGFGFVTYTTVEAAKKAIDDPDKTFGGRNIIVKLADSHRSKMVQAQVPSAIPSMTYPVAPGYPQPGKPPGVVAPGGYAYPQALGSYPASYPSPTPAHASYASQPQMPYPHQVIGKKDAPGLHQTVPAGMVGYPYYIAKQ